MRGTRHSSLPKHLGGTRDQLMHHPQGLCHPPSSWILPWRDVGRSSGSVFRDCSCWQGTEVIFTLTEHICPSLGQPLPRKNWGVESKTFHKAKEQQTAHTARKLPQWLTHMCPVRLNVGEQHWQSPQTSHVFVAFVFHRQTSVNGHFYWQGEEGWESILESSAGCFPGNTNFSICSERLCFQA